MTDFAQLSVKDITQALKDIPIQDYPALIQMLAEDERSSVKNIVLQLNKEYERYKIELKRIENLKRIEEEYYAQGFKIIAGTDEVGRGPLCGPVVSAAVILPRDSAIAHINDSKKLSAKMREELYDKITNEAVSIGIGSVGHKEIDKINILNASKKSMVIALNNLSVQPELLLLDAVTINAPVKQKSYIKGDEKIYSIAAASIIAKVTRDRMMEEYAKIYPQYHLEANKGYGSAEHIEAIKKYGPCEIHRRSFLNSFIMQTSNTNQIGLNYEKIAADFLRNEGFKVVTQNYRRGGGEIDIIFIDGGSYVFCEVKARSSRTYGTPEEFVDKAKQQKIINTAQKYMAEKVIFETGRFDIIAIDFDSDGKYAINHYKDAFQLA